MSDSLRDQLKQAGFKETAPAARPAKRKGGKSGPGKRATRQGQTARHTGAVAAARGSVSGPKPVHNPSGRQGIHQRAPGPGNDADTAAIEKRKAAKARIRKLIEADRVPDFAGESIYRFTQGSRIKQIFVTETVRQQLIAGGLLITRLNGSTYLVPPATGEAILAINPDWAMVRPGENKPANSDEDEYADFPVPDDLQW